MNDNSPQDFLRHHLLELDAQLKDPLTVLKFTALEAKGMTAPKTRLRRKTDIMLIQIDRIICILQRRVLTAQKNKIMP